MRLHYDSTQKSPRRGTRAVELLLVHRDISNATYGRKKKALRKTATAEAVPGFTLSYLLTFPDSAHDDGFCFDAVVASAAGAYILLSGICVAEVAVHPAGSNQCCPDRIRLC